MPSTHPIDQVLTFTARSLKELGFRKNRRNWWGRGPVSPLLSAQASQLGAARFTINLGVHLQVLSDLIGMPQLPDRPNVHHGHRIRRIGEFIGSDTWWETGPGFDLERQGQKVWAAIEKHALPWFESLEDLHVARDEFSHAPTVAAALSVALGDRKRAQFTLQAALDVSDPFLIPGARQLRVADILKTGDHLALTVEYSPEKERPSMSPDEVDKTARDLFADRYGRSGIDRDNRRFWVAVRNRQRDDLKRLANHTQIPVAYLRVYDTDHLDAVAELSAQLRQHEL